jgi:hypothetical protein
MSSRGESGAPGWPRPVASPAASVRWRRVAVVSPTKDATPLPPPTFAPPTHVCVLCRLARKELKNWLTSTVLFSNNHLL